MRSLPHTERRCPARRSWRRLRRRRARRAGARGRRPGVRSDKPPACARGRGAVRWLRAWHTLPVPYALVVGFRAGGGGRRAGGGWSAPPLRFSLVVVVFPPGGKKKKHPPPGTKNREPEHTEA